MKKLTAGIFATLVAMVSAGAARADIAATEYVNARLDTKENVSNRIEKTTDYNPLATNKDKTYPSVEVAEHIAREVIHEQVGDLDGTLGNYEQKDNKVSDYNKLNDTLNPINRNESYPTVEISERIANDVLDRRLEDLNLTQPDVAKFENTDNKVSDYNKLNDTANPINRSESYPTVEVAERIAHEEIDNRLRNLNLTDTSGNSVVGNFENKDNRVSGSDEDFDEKSQSDEYYPSMSAVGRIAHDMVENNLKDFGVIDAEGKNSLGKYELTENKRNVVVDGDNEMEVFPTVSLTKELIHEQVETVQNSVNNITAEGGVLDKLSNWDTSECSSGECIVKYDFSSNTFRLEPIARGENHGYELLSE